VHDNPGPEKHRVKFSAAEWACLQALGSSVSRLLARQEATNSFVISLDSAEAQELREYLTECLARLGFDQNYEVNEQGRLFEELIDRLFIR
jgi:hypothetical protein